MNITLIDTNQNEVSYTQTLVIWQGAEELVAAFEPDEETPAVSVDPSIEPADTQNVEEEIVADEAVESPSTPLKVFSWIAKFEEENPIPEDVNQEEETPLEIEKVTMTDTAELKILFTKSIVQQLPINITDSPESFSKDNIDAKDFIKLA